MGYNPDKVLSSKDIYLKFGRKRNLPVDIIPSSTYNKLKTNLVVASANQAYSCCIEYMSKWFYSKFPEGFFKTTYLEASHVLPYLQKMTNKDIIEPLTPAATISADIDMSFNRENIDLHNYGLNFYNNRTSYRDAFFIDRDRNLFISCTMEMLLMRFNFRMRLAHRGIQLDTAKLCQMAFRANGTQKHFNDLDYPVPTELIEQLAEDAGYTIDPNSFVSINTFLHYLNSNSGLPFMYKLDLSTQTMKWYIRMSNVIIHIKTDEIQADTGQQSGMKTTNYGVNFECQVRFPSPKFFAYYSMIETRDALKRIKEIDKKSFAINIEDLSKIPDKDEHGWNWNVKTEYMFDTEKEINIVKNKELGLEIEFEQLVGPLRDVIEYTKSIAISPEVFLNIKIYNYDKMVKCHVDWNTFTIYIDEPVDSCKTIILIYMDNAYFNENLIKIKNYEESRLNPTENAQGPDMKEKTNVLSSRS